MGPRERERRRPVFGSQELPPPPRPPKPERAGGTLDRVRDFLDRAGFESPQVDNRHRARSAEDSRRSTSEIRRVPRSRDSKRAHGDHCDESDPPVPPAPPAVPLAVPLPLPPPAPPSVPLPTPPPPPRPTHHSDRSLPSPPLRTRETQPKKKQRFLQPPPAPEARLPPAPPAPPPPAPPPAPPAWNDYEDNDYDGEYYEPWDDGYGPASPTWDDGYGAEPGAKVPTHLEYFSSDEEDESPDGEEASNSPALSYLPPPPPPPVPHDLQNFIPPPPQIPKGWGKGGKYGSRRKMASTHSPWFCNVCNKDLWNEEKYNTHVQDDHIPCPEEGCTFSGPEFVMAVHKLKHVKAADGSSVTDSPEELAAWRSMRKANFPSKGNLKRKAELEEKRRQSGALPDPPKVSMLEKLLRRTHQVERGKGFGGFGGFGYKGFGKKGKFKGKGKDGKGKEGKGKDWKGKDGKGKGKTSGKKGKGKSKWSVEPDGEPERRLDHATYSVPLPSVVANCVPLEAPFGGAPTSQVIPPSLPKWGPCRFFDRGFCFHGENCQYEHVGAGAMTQKVINSTAWWALPSSLANRAGRPGEGPAGGVFTSLRSRPLVATRVEPYVGAEQRERRDGLLRRLLQPDVERYYSAILQCVRYIVSTDFLRLERPHVERPMEPSVSQRDIQAELDAELLKEDLDDVDMSALHAALNQSE